MDAYIGRLLDSRYEILEVIGNGGMAVVYKALDHRLNRMVAVKILKDDLSKNQEFRRRFHAESQAVAMVAHPNIVGVYDVSRTAESDYIVMELIEGITLKQYLEKKGNLNWRETLHFSMQIAKALEHAHSKGIVHRDIKPHNIMILKDGSIKVADFGIARIGSAQNTLTREALGSVHYISPEQAKGARVDNRSDLYSLGVVMYEMLTGVTPYDGESPVAVAIQHINGAARCPSELMTGIPLGLEQITMHAMNANVDTRYTSATDMLRDMEEFRKTPGITFRFTAAAAASVSKPAAPRTEAERYASRASGKPEGMSAEQRRAERTRRETEKEQERRSKNLTIAIIVSAAVLVVLLLVILLVVLFGGDDNDEKSDGTKRTTASSIEDELLEMPSFVGMSYQEVVQAIEAGEYKDFEIAFEGTSQIGDLDSAKISKQSPNAMEMVEQGTLITLTVSPGNIMPDYSQMTESELVAYLNDLNLGLKITTETDFDDEIEKGKIIYTDPDIGEELEKEQEVTICVSLGSNKMPNLVGMTEIEALGILEELQKDISFEIVWDTDFDVNVEAGTVLETDPEEGDLLRDGKTVTVIVSLGDNTMPNVVNRTQAEAESMLKSLKERLDLTVEFVKEVSETVAEGSVIRTDPLAGDKLKENQKIKVYVSSGDGKVVVPDVLGRTEDEARQILEDAGFAVEVNEYYDEETPEGCVISQSEAPESRIQEGSTVTIDVSKGPEPTELPTESTEPTESTGPTENAEPTESAEP